MHQYKNKSAPDTTAKGPMNGAKDVKVLDCTINDIAVPDKEIDALLFD